MTDSTELTTTPGVDVPAVVHPTTGEIVPLDGPTSDLADWLYETREQEGIVRDLKRVVSEELVRRMDAEAQWTVHLGGWKLSAPSPAPSTEYDAEALWAELETLVAEGVISRGAMEAAVTRQYEYKHHTKGINALKRLGGAVATAIARCSRSVPKDNRNVSVKPERHVN